jgi:hypothetical protein
MHVGTGDYVTRKYQSSLISDVDYHAILYVDRHIEPDLIYQHCDRVSMELDTVKYWQIGQEPDIRDGMLNYFGGFGIESIDLYKEVCYNCYGIIRENNPNAKFILGLSTTVGWYGWLESFSLSPAFQLLDIIGIHHYNTFAYNMYNKDALELNVVSAKGFYKSVWVSEIGLGYNNGNFDIFQHEKAMFVRDTFADCSEIGCAGYMYYGYNPGWVHVDLKESQEAISIFTGL